MKRRRWDSKTKARVVLEGLRGRAVSEICSEYQISQAQSQMATATGDVPYYQWRDKFLSEAHQAFETDKDGGEVNRLRKKNAQLPQIIGALTVELKKTEDDLL